MATIGALSKPQISTNANWIENQHQELDLDASLEEDPSLQNLIIEKKETKRAHVIVCIDTSLSMTGKKLALTAVALASMAMQLEPEDLCVITFESEANMIKKLGEKIPLQELLRRFLDVPAKGLTNIEAGLLLARNQADRLRAKKKAVILMTDGRFTAGKNPDYIIPTLPTLHVVQTGSVWSSGRVCRNMARRGEGKFVRVGKVEHLPAALYSLVHEIIR